MVEAAPIQKELSIEERNELCDQEVRASLTKYDEGATKAIEAAKLNPNNKGIRPIIFDEMIKARKANLEELIAAVAKARRIRPIPDEVPEEGHLPRGTRDDNETIHRMSNSAFKEYNQKVEIQIKEAVGPFEKDPVHLDNQVKAAFEAVAPELPRGNLLTTLAKPFYDEENGGLKKGGIIGGLIGLVAGFMLGGGFEGGFIGIAVIALGAILGAMGGNFFGEMINPTKEPEPKSKIVQQKTKAPDGPGKGSSPTTEVAPAGVAPAGVAPAGVAPAGVAPAGVAPAGVTPAGVTADNGPAGRGDTSKPISDSWDNARGLVDRGLAEQNIKTPKLKLSGLTGSGHGLSYSSPITRSDGPDL